MLAFVASVWKGKEEADEDEWNRRGEGNIEGGDGSGERARDGKRGDGIKEAGDRNKREGEKRDGSRI